MVAKELFNPLKVYKKDLDVIDFLYKNLTQTNRSITVPFTNHCYYTLPLRHRVPVKYNIVDPDCFNFWTFATQKPELLCNISRSFFKAPAGEESDYFTMLEKKYHENKHPHLKPIITMILSRTNKNQNIFGGPYKINMDTCFSDWFYNKLRKYNSTEMQFALREPIDCDNGFHIQHIPSPDSLACFELFENDPPYDLFGQMKNFIFICDSEKEADKFDYDVKMKFESSILIAIVGF